MVYLSFARVTSIIRSAAGTFIDKVAESAAGRIDAQFKDVRDCVEVLTSLPSVREARVDNPAINVITAMLRNNNQLFNLYMGYDDGTFLEVDVIDRAGRGFRDKLAPPADAVYRQFVIRKTGEDGERAAKVVFLSQTLAPIAERSVPVDYDPRERPWYRDASHPDAGILTDPYIFFASGEPGYTLRIPIGEGRTGVVAGDILLSDADAILRDQRLGRSGSAFLFNDADRIVAHPRMSALIEAPTSEGATVTLPRLSTVSINQAFRPPCAHGEPGEPLSNSSKATTTAYMSHRFVRSKPRDRPIFTSLCSLRSTSSSRPFSPNGNSCS